MVSSDTAGTRSPATYFRNQNNLAARLQFGLIGILKNLAIDRHSHTFLNLAAETRVSFFQLPDELPECGRLHFEFGLATGELVARPARSDYDFRQANSFSGGIERRADDRWGHRQM